MFSFHRPKVYRSSTGCCICKAKSSSSRFTDSKKYEEDFMKCFKLAEPRQGEICNACVLLVKRWKKLPAGSDRNWKHVVDARAGPGMKSMSKFKSKSKKMDENCDKIKKKKHFDREYSPLSDNEDVEMTEVDFLCEDGPSGGSSRTTSPRDSDSEENVVKSRRHKGQAKRRDGSLPEMSDFICPEYWKRETICCGTIFKGMCGEVIVDNRFLKACSARMRCKLATHEVKTEPEVGVTKMFSDSSSDSGYDESSNQGTISGDSAFKKEQVSIEELNSQIKNN
ncbi:SIN3-HDAC complex-associated factor [Tribolium madens]|uniref:SIN3-HDAC complex-associated factor n=1 Tax=Tribolium madens TaxID=41895 RepID=UPI001CF73F0B|nr:SIN3-HDAC complex-associated factor [Tribolium madens]XP_044268947.1 SIN3-HDAC complex-associated factor [Tribolium madens]XP_044268948.1 SIN3-HDAC complex-associated factor [Tribolium madens]